MHARKAWPQSLRGRVTLQQTCINEEDVKVSGDVAASQHPHKCEKPGCYVGVCCRHSKLAHNIEPPWSKSIRVSYLQHPPVLSSRTYIVGFWNCKKMCTELQEDVHSGLTIRLHTVSMHRLTCNHSWGKLWLSHLSATLTLPI